MSKLIDITNTSLDGYVEDETGAFDWVIPDQVQPFITELLRPIGTQVPGIGASQSAESWSPDGQAIAYTAVTPEAGAHIMVTSLDDHASHPFADIKAPAGSPKFSPDGRWLAYCSNESGKTQVYVQAFPGPGAKIQVSNDGGTDPVWRRTGGELYFRNGDQMMAVSVSTAATFTAG
jgi:Tol biopolymer transport system component